ncbi:MULTISPECIES: cbb3-type cytochrome c oxidase subunit 3 [Neptuniibacter]|uniref:cbb3-type cytochrome oxidase subunit 3 n=1 Tax=Neptuniibacter TaxID=459520 RepID=UPI000830AEB2|nr:MULTISPECIES: cbb3-type cytochrome c oxidase subunit 3 [Neptuniibacter]MDO6513152.1 cbb3-type cytochrome c oxidase subunit 3 [Neptuniibacter sp. 2_MG-2023]MDO6592436.1 cbb3-type cytochrome c oxidase subunit 3 [Neptuniibacter sp. 1_MG-2023]
MNYEVYGPYIPVVMLITFLALFAWVLNPKNKEKYDDAANMPLQEPDEPILGDESNNGGDQK